MDWLISSNSVNTVAKVMGRNLSSYPWLCYPIRLVALGPARALARELNFEQRRRRHVSSIIRRIKDIEADVKEHESPSLSGESPVAFFNTTTTPGWVSFTSMIDLLTAWSLRLGGQRVISWTCHSGMIRCPQGTFPYAPGARPPCKACTKVKSEIFDYSMREYFFFDRSIRWRLALTKGMGIDELMAVRYKDIDIGRLCLPSLRHALKRHNLAPDKTTSGIYRDFILSAANIVDAFAEFLLGVQPRAAVVFNGRTFPEAIAREVALQQGIPVVTYEVGFRAHSASFSHGLAPEHQIEIPSSFQLGEHEEEEFDRYLEQRFSGDFTMGGVRFWPEMKSLGDELLAKASEYQQLVSIFTNTVYDTSQVSANTVFSSMFDWLEETLKLGRNWPNTLFIVRAHPDEFRSGRQKSLELVQDWLEQKGLLSMENLVFIPPTQYVSSYELVKASRFCVVYNSTIGLEAAMLGIPVICGGLTKYSSASFVHSFDGRDEYLSQFSQLLAADSVTFRPEWRDEARRFFYYLFFKSSLDLSRFVEPNERAEGLTLRRFPAEELRPDRSEEMQIIYDGIVKGSDFYYG